MKKTQIAHKSYLSTKIGLSFFICIKFESDHLITNNSLFNSQIDTDVHL